MKAHDDGLLGRAIAAAVAFADEQVVAFGRGDMDGCYEGETLADLVAAWREWEQRDGLTSETLAEVVLDHHHRSERLTAIVVRHYFARLDQHIAGTVAA